MFAATLRIIVTIVIIHTVIIEDVENCIVLHFSSSPAFPPSPVAATFACCRRVCRQRAPRRVETWPRSHGPQVHMRSCALISNLSESLVCPLILCFLMSGTDDAANATNFDFAEVWVRPTEHRTSKQAPGGRVLYVFQKHQRRVTIRQNCLINITHQSCWLINTVRSSSGPKLLL